MIDETGYASVRVTGISMLPLLHHMRDSVVIARPDHLHVGDIVLFDRRNGRYALHRVIHKGKNGFSMAGDNQWYYDKNLPYDQIEGVVTTINRNGRSISCSKVTMKLYARVVAFLAKPRIIAARPVRRLYRIAGTIGTHTRKE